MSNSHHDVWVIDPHPDHAALQREALELAFPQFSVQSFAQTPAPQGRTPDLIVIDRECGLGEWQDQEPVANGRVVWVAQHGGGRWPGLGETLDKQHGGAFFNELIEAVTGAIGSATPSSVGFHESHVSAGRQTLAQPAAVASLIASVRSSLDDLQRVHQLLGRRLDPDATDGRLMLAQAGLLRRADGVLARLEALVESAGEACAETLPLDSWLALRSGAWPALLGPATPSLTTDPTGGPWVRLSLDAMGHLVDELLVWFARQTNRAPEVRTSHVYLDRSYRLEHTGAIVGRYARLDIRSVPATPSNELPSGLVHTAIALARAHLGYAEIGPGRVGLLLPLAEPSSRVAAKPRVLVGDADRRCAASLVEAFGGDGIDVATCPSSAAAEALLAAGCRYDLVLFDLDDQRGDAAATVRRLRDADPRVRCICLTPGLQSQSLRELTSAGAFGYCPKPLDPPQLSSWLRPLLAPIR